MSPRHDFSEGGLIQSQLSKYYDFATKEAGGKKETHFYLFVPNYNKLDIRIFLNS